jgi:hypothetical protein
MSVILCDRLTNLETRRADICLRGLLLFGENVKTRARQPRGLVTNTFKRISLKLAEVDGLVFDKANAVREKDTKPGG